MEDKDFLKVGNIVLHQNFQLYAQVVSTDSNCLWYPFVKVKILSENPLFEVGSIEEFKPECLAPIRYNYLERNIKTMIGLANALAQWRKSGYSSISTWEERRAILNNNKSQRRLIKKIKRLYNVIQKQSQEIPTWGTNIPNRG